MNRIPLFQDDEVVALVRPALDAHTLGVSYAASLIEDCGYRAVIAGEEIAAALDRLDDPGAFALVHDWLRDQGATRLGFSYRLDPAQAAADLTNLLRRLTMARMLADQGGPLRAVYFAGLPPACALVQERWGARIVTFRGDESPREAAHLLGIPLHRLPSAMTSGSEYDELRMDFARQLVETNAYQQEERLDRTGVTAYGNGRERLVDRVDHGRSLGLPPLIRVHAGPYAADRLAAVAEFKDWARRLAGSGLLDVLSIGTSQLTQSDFGGDWTGRSNGGGVPVHSEREYREIAAAARPMLVRTYAGTRRIEQLAHLHERSLDIAWHALSFWWFSRLDGRGPNDVLANLVEHHRVLDVVAATGKPFEPNIPHHFSFRGGDDATYVLSGYLAARSAKRRGVRTLVLQVMLNTPKATLGVQDLAKARALLALVRPLEDANFRVLLQPRAGLDYFSPDLTKARVQLAAVSALMADIEPTGPDIVHVVSYSEAVHLADPSVIDESIRLTRHALRRWPEVRDRLGLAGALQRGDVAGRTAALLGEVRGRIEAMEAAIPDLYSPLGLYCAFAAGYLPAPSLWGCQDEFTAARAFRTKLVDGGVRLVDAAGRPLAPAVHLAAARQNLGNLDRIALARRAAELEQPAVYAA